MGIRLFGTDISGLIKKFVGPGVLPATLFSFAQGTRTTGALTSGKNPISTEHSCRGFVDSYEDRRVDGTIIKSGDRIVSIVGDSIDPPVVPAPNDQVTIEGRKYVLVNVERDPAAALYTCQAR